jgi:hypothetical protein
MASGKPYALAHFLKEGRWDREQYYKRLSSEVGYDTPTIVVRSSGPASTQANASTP